MSYLRKNDYLCMIKKQHYFYAIRKNNEYFRA